MDDFLNDPSRKKVTITVPNGFRVSSLVNPFGLAYRKTVLFFQGWIIPSRFKNWLLQTTGLNLGEEVCVPNYIKFDAGLLANIHRAPLVQHTMLEALAQTAKAVGARALAEGIEVRADADTCRALGFDLAQGYLFGAPSPPDDEETLFGVPGS